MKLHVGNLSSSPSYVKDSCKHAIGESFEGLFMSSFLLLSMLKLGSILTPGVAIYPSQAYLAFFVIDDLQMDQSAKALVPAIIYISSFVVSVLLQEIPWNGRRLRAYYSAGGIIWIFCGAAILLLPRDISSFMYAISVFIGIANALMMVTAISMQSVLVGAEVGGCAFVCGSLSFLDKMSCGLALYVLQSHQSTSPRTQLNNSQQSAYLSVTRYGLGLVPALCSFVGVAVTFFMELEAAGSLSKPLLEALLE